MTANRLKSYRFDNQSKLKSHWAALEGPAARLQILWPRLIDAGVPSDYVLPGGATDPYADMPEDSPVSEWFLRFHESLFGKQNLNSPWAPQGFRRDYERAYANLELACTALVNLGVRLRVIELEFNSLDLCRFIDGLRGVSVPEAEGYPRVLAGLGRIAGREAEETGELSW
jgi:hypothetical protein